MSGYLAPRDASDSDYEAIQLAVMESERGRWFLAEYARRNRHADTEMLQDSLMRIERSINAHREPAELDRFRIDVLEMSRAIARTRAEIAAIKPPETHGHIVEASDELDSIVSTTEQATSEILAAAERIQEVAWTLREAGADSACCDLLDYHAVATYTACSFQDLTAQRTRKVIEILGFLEKRVNAMADIWQFAERDGDKLRAASQAAPDFADPSMSQADVDFVLVDSDVEAADFEIEMAGPGPMLREARFDAQEDGFDIVPASGDVEPLAATDEDAPPASPEPSRQEEALHDVVVPADVPDDATLDDAVLFFAPDPLEMPPVDGRPQLALVDTPRPEAVLFRKAKEGQPLTAAEAAAALDALRNMSVEERTRLFS